MKNWLKRGVRIVAPQIIILIIAIVVLLLFLAFIGNYKAGAAPVVERITSGLFE